MPRNDEPTRRLGPNETQEIVEPTIATGERIDPLVGEIIGGRYQLLATLGHGGFGRVYRSRDLKLDRVVALKLMLEAPGAAETESRLRVLRETRANARLQHPNIVTLHDAGEDPRGLYLVLEYVAGTSLAEVLASGPLPPERAAEILRECALALAAAHAQGIIHRDIKPANILLSENGQVKIADFGIARLLGETHATDRGSIIGTPNYMAPEQIDGRGVGPAADIFELGCVAYEMISGRPPFHGGTPSEVIGRILRGVPDPLPPLGASVSPLVDLITQMLNKSAANRPLPSAIIEALDAWRTSRGDRRVHELRRSLDWRIVLAVVAIATMVGAIVVVGSWRRDDARLASAPPPSPTLVEPAPPERDAPTTVGRTSVTFSNRDNVFRYLDFLGRDREQVKRLDDLTLQLDGPAQEIAKRAEQARIIDSMPAHGFDLGHSLFSDGSASDKAVTLSFESITAAELVDLFAWSTGWPVVQRGDFTELSKRLGPLRIEARAQPWDVVVAKLLESTGAEAVRVETAWLVVPKGALVRDPLRVLGIYDEPAPLRKVEESLGDGRGQDLVVLRDETSEPHGLIVVAPSRRIAAIRNRLAAEARDGRRLAEPRVFTGEPMSLRAQNASCSELATLAGGPRVDDSGSRVSATVSEVPKDELLSIALSASALGAGVTPDTSAAARGMRVEVVLPVSSRLPSFYAPLAILAGPDGSIVADEDAKRLKIRGVDEDAESIRRVVAAIESMLARR